MTRNDQDLAALLRQPGLAGIYSVPHGEWAARVRLPADLPLQIVDIDLTGCTDKASLLRRLAAAYRFPDWFGHNWDALADSLRDLGWLPAEGYLILIRGFAGLPDAMRADVETLLEILADTTAEWAADGTAFWVLIEDGGPEIPALFPAD